MPTLDDFISNREAYPDTTKITLAEGVEATLGDLRRGNMMERDYRKKTTELANQRRAFEQDRVEWEGARVEAEAKLTDIAKQLVARNPESTRDDIDEALERDPVARKLSQQINALETKVTERDKEIESTRQRMRTYEETYIADQHRKVLSYLKTQDPALDETELVNFARANYMPRLDIAYRVMTEDRRMKAATDTARKEAHEEAYKKAKSELLQPAITPRRVVPPAADAPKNFDEAAIVALQDPEVHRALLGE